MSGHDWNAWVGEGPPPWQEAEPELLSKAESWERLNGTIRAALLIGPGPVPTSRNCHDAGWDARSRWVEALADCLGELGGAITREETTKIVLWMEHADDLLRKYEEANADGQ